MVVWDSITVIDERENENTLNVIWQTEDDGWCHYSVSQNQKVLISQGIYRTPLAVKQEELIKSLENKGLKPILKGKHEFNMENMSETSKSSTSTK